MIVKEELTLLSSNRHPLNHSWVLLPTFFLYPPLVFNASTFFSLSPFLSAGDIIELINTASSDWWKGSIRQNKGYFPASYAQVRIGSSKLKLTWWGWLSWEHAIVVFVDSNPGQHCNEGSVWLLPNGHWGNVFRRRTSECGGWFVRFLV